MPAYTSRNCLIPSWSQAIVITPSCTVTSFAHFIACSSGAQNSMCLSPETKNSELKEMNLQAASLEQQESRQHY